MEKKKRKITCHIIMYKYIHVYIDLFLKNSSLWFLYAASNKKKSECTANKASSI